MTMQPILLRVGFAAILVVTLSCNFVTSLVPGDSDIAASLVLNEVLFLPAEGQYQFVELKAIKATSLDGSFIVNEDQQSYAPPSGVRLNAGEVALILFDGQGKVEGNTIHADRAGVLDSKSGFIELKAPDGRVLDRVAWGKGQAGAVYLSRGGFVSELRPGATIARSPQSADSNPWAWMPLPPAQATPGSLNPAPAVEVLLPYDGSLFDSPDVRLAWYTVPDALEYRLQIAAERTFASPLVDERVQAPAPGILTVATFTTNA
ncbi:MAG: hypothetical protein ACRD88_21715, partial [Terriglobia bacterium]